MGVHIHNLQHLLARHAVHALGARAVVSQPLMMKRTDPSIGPLHKDLILQHPYIRDVADLRVSTEIGDSGGGLHGGS